MRAAQRVVVTGCGAVSAVGATTGAFWEALLAGRSGIARLPRFVAAHLPVTVGARWRRCRSGTPIVMSSWANRAIDEALGVAGLKRSDVGFIWATGLDTYQEGDQGPVFPAGRQLLRRLSRSIDPAKPRRDDRHPLARPHAGGDR